MRIAQVAPLAERVPPELYGGTERVVSALTEELIRRGHEVTLFASGDSATSATLVPVTDRALRLDPAVRDPHAYTLLQLGQVFERAGAFDLIHNHLDYFAWPFARLVRTPVLTTLHGRLDLPDLPPLYRRYRDAPLASISDDQRAPFPRANWVATVYNGIDLGPYPFHDRPGGYLAFIGRIAPEKNLEGAIAIARATGIPLKIAAKVDPVDEEYYQADIKPLIDGRHVEYVGEIGEHEKAAFLGPGHALLFAVDWPEPFGLAMAEAMACGTPVLGLRRGAIPEVVEDGVTGFVRDTEAELAEAAWRIPELNRDACRRRAEAHFSAAAMADGYEAVYRRLAGETVGDSIVRAAPTAPVAPARAIRAGRGADGQPRRGRPAMPLTEEQKGHLCAELESRLPALRRAAPPERAKLVREALERVGAMPTWDEWDACAAELLGDDAALVISGALRR